MLPVTELMSENNKIGSFKSGSLQLIKIITRMKQSAEYVDLADCIQCADK